MRLGLSRAAADSSRNVQNMARYIVLAILQAHGAVLKWAEVPSRTPFFLLSDDVNEASGAFSLYAWKIKFTLLLHMNLETNGKSDSHRSACPAMRLVRLTHAGLQASIMCFARSGWRIASLPNALCALLVVVNGTDGALAQLPLSKEYILATPLTALEAVSLLRCSRTLTASTLGAQTGDEDVQATYALLHRRCLKS